MARTIDGIEHVTVHEAAAELSTTHLRVMMLLKEKALLGIEAEGEWLVTRDSLECCKTHGADRKVARGCTTSCSSGGCGCK